MGLSITATASPTTGPAPLTVGFVATATGGSPPYYFQWTYGDGQQADPGPGQTHTYYQAAVYRAFCVVTDSAGRTAANAVNVLANSTDLFPSGQGLQKLANGQIRAFTPAEVAAMDIAARGVRDGSHPTQTRTISSSTVRRVWFCAGPYFESFAAWLLGGQCTWTDGSVSPPQLRVSRLLPQTFPGKPQLVATQITSAKGARGVGIQDKDGVPLYPGLEVEALYEQVAYKLLTDAQVLSDPLGEGGRFLEQLPSTSDNKYLNLPGGTLVYKTADGSLPSNINIPYNIGVIEPTSTIRYKWCRLPFSAWGPGTPLYTRVFGADDGTSLPFAGTINSVKLLGRPPGTMKFLGVEEELLKDPLAGFPGDPDMGLCWDLTYSWETTHHPGGWNAFFFSQTDPTKTKATGYYSAVRSGTPPAPYTAPGQNADGDALWNARDHNLLFRIGA